MIVLPPWQFSDYTTNLTGTPASVPGTDFDTGLNNADGSTFSVLSALGHDAHLFEIICWGVFNSGDDGNALLDVMVDPAGGTSWTEFISDLCVGCSMDNAASTSRLPTRYYTFPIFIAAGSSIGVRCRSSIAADNWQRRVIINVYGNPSRPEMWWCGQKVESLGINASTSRGTAVTPGASGTYSSWTTIATTSHHWGAMQYAVGGNNDSNMLNTRGYHFQVGYGSQQCPGTCTVGWSTGAAETISITSLSIPIWCDIPTGTTMQVRATSSGTAEACNFALYGVY